MKKIVLTLLVGLVVLTGCSKPAGKDLYTLIEKDEIQAKIEAKENFVLIIGRDTCPACKAYKEVLDEVIKNKGIDIFYFEIIESVWKDKDYEEFTLFLERVMSQPSINGFPTTYFVEEGVVTGNYTGMLDYKPLLDELVDRGLDSK